MLGPVDVLGLVEVLGLVWEGRNCARKVATAGGSATADGSGKVNDEDK